MGAVAAYTLRERNKLPRAKVLLLAWLAGVAAQKDNSRTLCAGEQRPTHTQVLDRAFLSVMSVGFAAMGVWRALV